MQFLLFKRLTAGYQLAGQKLGLHPTCERLIESTLSVRMIIYVIIHVPRPNPLFLMYVTKKYEMGKSMIFYGGFDLKKNLLKKRKIISVETLPEL